MSKRGQREGTIYQRADGRWHAQMTTDTGKRKNFYGKTRQEVARKLTAAQRDRDQGLPIAREDQRLGQWVTHWLTTIRPPATNLREYTWRGYQQLLERHVVPTLGTVRLARLTPESVQTLYAAKLADGLSSTSVHHLHAVLHRCLEAAVRLGLVARNITDLVDAPPMRPHAIRPLTAEQARAFLAAAHGADIGGDRLRTLYLLALATGMRQGELFALRWQDLDLDAGAGARPSLQVRRSVRRIQGQLHFNEPKTARGRRRIALAPSVAEALRGQRTRQLAERLMLGPAWDDGDLVFPNPVGHVLDPSNVTHTSFRPLLRRAGLPQIRFHDLRHTAATLLLLRHVNPKVVSELLGHASVAITLDIYSHVLPDMQHDAAAVMEDLLGSTAQGAI